MLTSKDYEDAVAMNRRAADIKAGRSDESTWGQDRDCGGCEDKERYPMTATKACRLPPPKFSRLPRVAGWNALLLTAGLTLIAVVGELIYG